MTSKIKIFAIFILCLVPQIAGAEFLGVKKVTEPIVFPVNGPIDTLGRQTLAFATPDHPDSITVFTYLDDGTFIAWDSGGAAYACPGIDTTSRRGETQIWFNRKIHWIDGIPTDSNSYTLSVAVWVWEDGYYRETNASVQVVTDSLNQLYTVRDTLNVYDSDTRTWGANLLKYEGQDDVDVEIQSEAADALTAYDPPTNAEMEARTPWNATTMDSALQALDYTNNTHGVLRENMAGLDADTGIAGLKTKLTTIATNSGYLIAATGTDNAGGSASSVTIDIDGAPANQDVNNFFNGMLIVGVTGQNAGAVRKIITDVSGGFGFHTLTLPSGAGFANTIASGDDFVILNVADELMRGTNNAALAAFYTTGRAGYLDKLNMPGRIADSAQLANKADTLMNRSRPDSVRAVIAKNASDSVWAKDTSNTLWNDLSRFGEYNALAQAATGSACGSGLQSLTIQLLDTSGTDAVVPYGFISINNSGLTSVIVYGTANSLGVNSDFKVDASTAYVGLATANGFYFPNYSFTTGAGASHTDTIRGYDIPTSSGSAVPSNQQGQLYGDVISPANDTLFGAEITIVLAGSSEFFTSTHLVPPARVVVYAGSQGAADAGRWQATLFRTDSLMAPGEDNATYTIVIKHSSLATPITYEGVTLTATGPVNLRDILDAMD